VNEVLGGLSRITFQMGVSALPHEKMPRAVEILGASRLSFEKSSRLYLRVRLS